MCFGCSGSRNGNGRQATRAATSNRLLTRRLPRHGTEPRQRRLPVDVVSGHVPAAKECAHRDHGSEAPRPPAKATGRGATHGPHRFDPADCDGRRNGYGSGSASQSRVPCRRATRPTPTGTTGATVPAPKDQGSSQDVPRRSQRHTVKATPKYRCDHGNRTGGDETAPHTAPRSTDSDAATKEATTGRRQPAPANDNQDAQAAT